MKTICHQGKRSRICKMIPMECSHWSRAIEIGPGLYLPTSHLSSAPPLEQWLKPGGFNWGKGSIG
jgi:hypothetical protein